MEVTTRSVKIALRPDGIVTMITRADWDEPDTLEVATETMETLRTVIDGKNRSLMCHLPNTHLPKEVIEYYRTVDTGVVAIALFVNSFGAKIMGNIFLKIASKRDIPIKIFMKETEAVRWLHQKMEAAAPRFIK